MPLEILGKCFTFGKIEMDVIFGIYVSNLQ